MSTVAGRMAPQVAAHFLERPHGGRGILLGGADGVLSAKVVILGGGVVGTHAAQIAVGMGGNVAIATRSAATVWLSQRFGGGIHAVTAGPAEVDALCKSADVVVGAALVTGAAAPKLVLAGTVKAMKPGAVIVDASIDQGGCVETSHPTTHSRPSFVVDGVVHYCVANMPGAVPRALIDDIHLQNGLNIHASEITCRAVAEALRLPYTPAADILRPVPGHFIKAL
jgi:alanine dehydrogenase